MLVNHVCLSDPAEIFGEYMNIGCDREKRNSWQKLRAELKAELMPSGQAEIETECMIEKNGVYNISCAFFL